MYLGNRKVIGKSFRSGYDKVPAKESDTELLRLVQRLRSGDKTVCERIILGHLGLSIQIVGRYVAYFPTRADDLMSVATLALTEAVNKFDVAAKNNNITGYIVGTIHGRISDYLKEHDHTVKISSHARKIAKERAKKNNVEAVYTKSINFEDLEKSKQVRFLAKMSYTVNDELEYQEIIDKCCFTRFEYMVYTKMMEGMSEADIAKEMRVSKQRVWIVKKDLIKKINHHLQTFEDKVGDLTIILNKFWSKK